MLLSGADGEQFCQCCGSTAPKTVIKENFEQLHREKLKILCNQLKAFEQGRTVRTVRQHGVQKTGRQ